MVEEIAYILYQKTIDYLKKNYPHSKLDSYVKPDNISSQKLHKKVGFTTNYEVKDFDCYRYLYDMKRG